MLILASMSSSEPVKPTYQTLVEENEALSIENEKLKAQILVHTNELARLKKLISGAKSERFIPSENALQLALQGFAGEDRATSAVATEQITYTRKKSKQTFTPHGRNPLPEHLPRKEILIEPDCDTTQMKKIGEDVTEELEYEPGKLYVNRYVRPKYAHNGGDGVVIGTLPTRPIEKGIAGPGLVQSKRALPALGFWRIWRSASMLTICRFIASANSFCVTMSSYRLRPSVIGSAVPVSFCCRSMNSSERSSRAPVIYRPMKLRSGCRIPAQKANVTKVITGFTTTHSLAWCFSTTRTVAAAMAPRRCSVTSQGVCKLTVTLAMIGSVAGTRLPIWRVLRMRGAILSMLFLTMQANVPRRCLCAFKNSMK
jgi:hypothetical protein